LKFLILFLLLPLLAGAADYHHVHMRAADTLRAATWYADNMNGEQLRVAEFYGVRFERTLLLFAETTRPGADGSAAPTALLNSNGTALDHLGFSFADLEAQLISLQLAGAKVIQPITKVSGLFSYALIEDPWGQKVEVMHDPDLIGLHHAHVVSTDPGGAIHWYQQMFGGEATTFKNQPMLPAIRYGDFWLIASKSNQEPVTNMFTMLDHLGFRMIDVESEMDRMANAKTKILAAARSFYWWQMLPFMPGPKQGFIESPDGVVIEVLQTN